MKKLIIIGSVFGFSGTLWATFSIFGAPPISVMTLTQVAASTPTYVGQPVVCSNCISQNNGVGTICISTEATTAQNAFIVEGSSQATTTTCK